MPAPRRRFAVLAVVWAASAVLAMILAGTPSAGARGRTRECGAVRTGGRLYRAVETHGDVSCRRVRQVASGFLDGGRTPRGWHCFRDNSSSGQPFAASCARGRTVVVRIYAPN